MDKSCNSPCDWISNYHVFADIKNLCKIAVLEYFFRWVKINCRSDQVYEKLLNGNPYNAVLKSDEDKDCIDGFFGEFKF